MVGAARVVAVAASRAVVAPVAVGSGPVVRRARVVAASPPGVARLVRAVARVAAVEVFRAVAVPVGAAAEGSPVVVARAVAAVPAAVSRVAAGPVRRSGPGGRRSAVAARS